MKKVLSKVFCFILCFLLCGSSVFMGRDNLVVADGGVIIPNSSFEEWSSGNKATPKSWIIDTYLWLKKSTVSVSGKSVNFVSGGSDITLSTIDSVAINGGESYTFGYKCKSGNSSGVKAKINIYTYDQEEVRVDVIESEEFLVYDDSWYDVSVDFDAGESIQSVKIFIVIDTTLSECFVDDAYGQIKQKPIVQTHTGASLRLVKDSPGIRFSGSVDKKTYDSYLTKYKNVSAGILITTEDVLGQTEELTVDAVLGKQHAFITAEIWNNEKSAETDGFYGFYCALTNIKEQNIQKRFCVRAYLKYDENDVTKYIYGNYNFLENARSAKEVACSARENADEYTSQQLEIINYYADFVYQG